MVEFQLPTAMGSSLPANGNPLTAASIVVTGAPVPVAGAFAANNAAI